MIPTKAKWGAVPKRAPQARGSMAVSVAINKTAKSKSAPSRHAAIAAQRPKALPQGNTRPDAQHAPQAPAPWRMPQPMAPPPQPQAQHQQPAAPVPAPQTPPDAIAQHQRQVSELRAMAEQQTAVELDATIAAATAYGFAQAEAAAAAATGATGEGATGAGPPGRPLRAHLMQGPFNDPAVLAVLRHDEHGVLRNERGEPVDAMGRLIRPRGERGGREKAAYDQWYGPQEKVTDDHVRATGAMPLIGH